jgi:hypothetical protein
MIGLSLQYGNGQLFSCFCLTVFLQLRLMNFIRRIGRDEIYIKYVHQLVNVSINTSKNPL